MPDKLLYNKKGLTGHDLVADLDQSGLHSTVYGAGNARGTWFLLSCMGYKKVILYCKEKTQFCGVAI